MVTDTDTHSSMTQYLHVLAKSHKPSARCGFYNTLGDEIKSKIAAAAMMDPLRVKASYCKKDEKMGILKFLTLGTHNAKTLPTH